MGSYGYLRKIEATIEEQYDAIQNRISPYDKSFEYICIAHIIWALLHCRC